jgi:hypothetical protein
MEFGIPSKKRTVKKEKHPNTAVITLLPYEGENTSRKMEFNEKAYEVLGLKKDDTNKVAFSFNRSDMTQNAIVNANEFDSDASLNIAKNGKLSNKSHYEEIKKRYNEDAKSELELTVVDNGAKYNNQVVFDLVTLSSVQKEKEEGSTIETPKEDVEEGGELAEGPSILNTGQSSSNDETPEPDRSEERIKTEAPEEEEDDNDLPFG